MRAIVVALVVLLGAGCVNGVMHCATQSDCPDGRCDTSTGICAQVAGGGVAEARAVEVAARPEAGVAQVVARW